MYDELVKALRIYANDETDELRFEAADAIEELRAAVEGYEANTNMVFDRSGNNTVIKFEPKWIVFETRPMDEEERRYYSEQYGFGLADDEAVIYCSQMPDHGQEVLVCNKYGQIWIDTFDDDPDYGVGFETNGDMDGLVAWMPLPKPYEPPKEE